MRFLTVALLIATAMTGCLSADEPAEPIETQGEDADAFEPVVEEPQEDPEPEPVWTNWWMPCDWEDFAPAKSAGAWTDRNVLHIAHQGGENEVPSATMYALKTSLRKGADLLEIDVHITSDGHIVVLHDTTVDRTTDGSGAVESLTLAEIKALDAGYWFVPEQHRAVTTDANETAYVFRGIRTGEREAPPGCTAQDFTIPTLREVLETFPDVMLNIEIKNGLPQSTVSYEQELADILTEFGRTDDVIVASFVDSWTEMVHVFTQDGIDTSTGTGQTAIFKLTTMELGPGSPTLLHEAFQVPITFEGIEVVNADFVADAHAHGMAVHVWTINDPDEMHWLIDIGVDGIMTAEPAVLEAVLAERDVRWP